MNLPFFIARRYLLHQKGAFSAFIIRLAVIATGLSVATMIVAIAFVTGFKYEVREKLFSFWGHIQITPFTPNVSTILTPDPVKRDLQLEQKVRTTEHVKDIAPFVIRPVIAHANKLMEGIKLKGINDEYHLSGQMVIKGGKIDYSDTGYSKQVMLPATIADRLNVKAGDEIKLYFLEQGSVFPRIRKVQVASVFSTGMEEVDREYGLCDIRLLQHINNWSKQDINGYQVTLDDEQYSDLVASQIHHKYIEVGSILTTYTMKEIFPNIMDWLQLQDVNARVIIIIMTIVALINMVVVLLILIVEHARMVGILKAQGMAQAGIRKIFLYYSVIIAGIGIVIGNVLGLGLCWLQKTTNFLTLPEATYYVKYVPVRIFWWQPLLIDTVTVLLCILCMWLPTLYIRRIQPARVLQFK